MKRGETGKLVYDFDQSQHLEICIEDKWYRSTAREFRSFDGKRRINNNNYEGSVYYFKTNDKVMSLLSKENIIYSPSVDYIEANKRIGETF